MTERIWPEKTITTEEAMENLMGMRDLYDTGPMAESLDMAIEALNQRWIPVTERLPEKGQEVFVVSHGWETDYHDIYIGKLEPTPAGDGSGNFFGIPTPGSEWTIWGWSYYRKPEVVAWRPLFEPYVEDETCN